MLDAKAFGSAAALVTLIIYAVCVALAAAAPELLFNYAVLITHGLNLELLRTATVSLNMGNIILGAVLWLVSTWAVFYLAAIFYNNFRKGK